MKITALHKMIQSFNSCGPQRQCTTSTSKGEEAVGDGLYDSDVTLTSGDPNLKNTGVRSLLSPLDVDD